MFYSCRPAVLPSVAAGAASAILARQGVKLRVVVPLSGVVFVDHCLCLTALTHHAHHERYKEKQRGAKKKGVHIAQDRPEGRALLQIVSPLRFQRPERASADLMQGLVKGRAL